MGQRQFAVDVTIDTPANAPLPGLPAAEDLTAMSSITRPNMFGVVVRLPLQQKLGRTSSSVP